MCLEGRIARGALEKKIARGLSWRNDWFRLSSARACTCACARERHTNERTNKRPNERASERTHARTHKSDHKSTPRRPKIAPKSHENRPEIDRKSTKNRSGGPRTDLGRFGAPRGRSRDTPGTLRTRPRAIPDAPGTLPGDLRALRDASGTLGHSQDASDSVRSSFCPTSAHAPVFASIFG